MAYQSESEAYGGPSGQRAERLRRIGDTFSTFVEQQRNGGRGTNSTNSIAPIFAPTQTSLGQGYNEIQQFVPKFKPIANQNLTGIDSNQFGTINPQTLAGIDSNQFGAINGYGEDYYKNLSDAAAKRLNQQYFTNNDSILAQRSNELKRRGVFGDAIGENAVNDVYKNYGSQLSDFASQLATTKAQNDLSTSLKNRDFNLDVAKNNQDVNKFNIQSLLDSAISNRNFGFDIAKNNQDVNKFNISSAFDTDKYNTDTQNALAELGLKGSLDAAANKTKYDTSMFDTEIKDRASSREQLNAKIERLQAIASDKNIDRDTRNSARDQLLQLIYL